MKKYLIIFIEKHFPTLICSEDAEMWLSNPRLWNPLDISGCGDCQKDAHETGSCACGKFRDLTPEQKEQYKQLQHAESEF